MSQKLVSDPFLICSSITISNAAVYVSSVSSIKTRDTFTYQWIWAGVSSTTFYVQTSNDYSPGLPQNPGALNAGHWDSIPFNTTPTTNSGSSYTAVVNFTGPAWSRFMSVTASSGTATLMCYTSSKAQ